MHETRPLKN